jgi:hypothetical protein
MGVFSFRDSLHCINNILKRIKSEGFHMNSLIEKGTRCLLIHPKCSKHTYYNFVDVYKLLGAKYLETPLGLLTVAALLPQQWEFKLIDENVEPLCDHHLEWADMVFIGSTSKKLSSCCWWPRPNITTRII